MLRTGDGEPPSPREAPRSGTACAVSCPALCAAPGTAPCGQGSRTTIVRRAVCWLCGGCPALVLLICGRARATLCVCGGTDPGSAVLPVRRRSRIPVPGAYGRIPYARIPCALPGWGRGGHVRMPPHKGRKSRVQPSAITQPPTLLGHPGDTATGRPGLRRRGERHLQRRPHPHTRRRNALRPRLVPDPTSPLPRAEQGTSRPRRSAPTAASRAPWNELLTARQAPSVARRVGNLISPGAFAMLGPGPGPGPGPGEAEDASRSNPVRSSAAGPGTRAPRARDRRRQW